METKPALLALWAKTDQRGQRPDAWHPLICHMIDVAVVARAMWREVLTPALRARITDGLGLPDEATAEVWVAFLAGLHDVGKASPAFQAKYPGALDRLAAIGLRCHPDLHDPGHGVISTVAIRPLLEERDVTRKVANTIATAIGGHHGIFPTAARVQRIPDDKVVSNSSWVSARHDLSDQLATLLGLPSVAPSQIDHPTSMVLAGLVSVADWIGSDSDKFFHFATPDAIADEDGLRRYMREAEATAERALTELGWRGWTAPVDSVAFDSLFGFEPRPVQQRVVDLPGVADGPGIVIVELPMGEGKTEAALYLADRWAQGPAQRGLYVAMPTMATSNGMFPRLVGYLEQRFVGQQVNVQLIHSHAAIAPELDALKGAPAPINAEHIAAGSDANEPSAAFVGEWFSMRKRGLLAPYGVGTVDQSLLAALQVAHVFVRTFGLAGKTVIFDEVHAYDTYMSTLFERLLEWLGAIGSSVVILTATLPKDRRDALLRHYAKGAGYPTDCEIAAASYPRLSWATAACTNAEPVDVAGLSELSRRKLEIRWVDMRLPDPEQPFPLGEALRDALREGGCAAVICNTVGRAQQTYQRLKEYVEPHEIDLLHARFPFGERDEREKRALARFGKDGSERPQRSVLVATQVIEQSLDLDFDLMVTDLAPADLVLQRAGRLQRHDRKRLARFGDGAVLWVGEPEQVEGNVPTFDGGSAAIYDTHVLLRSWLALKDRPTVTLPTDIETIIEEVYDDRACPSDDIELIGLWNTTAAKQKEAIDSDKDQATGKRIPQPRSGSPLWAMTRDPTLEDSPEAHTALQALTRLARPSLSVVFLWATPTGASYDAAGTKPIDISVKPGRHDVRELLLHAVSISHQRVFFDLLKERPPTAWQESSLLRRHRLLLLDEHNRTTTDRFVLELHPELGLLISET